MKNAFKSLLLAFTTLIAGVSAFAQVTTSTLQGRITDQNGEPVIGAAIVAHHEPSGTVYGAVSNTEGRYTIQGMRTGGPYSVEVSNLGYQSVNYTDITLQLGQPYNLNIWLQESAEFLDAVVVVASPTSKFAAQEKVGATTNISSAQMTQLPNPGRSLVDVGKLSPFGGNSTNFSGSSGRSANFTVDGANVNNNFGLSTSLPGGGNPISIDAIEEVQIVISPYDVRQTNFIGGGINAITKSGTNTVKGSAYVYHQNEKLHGNKVDGVEMDRNKDRNTTYGFTVGGPIIKNKLFFFLNGEMSDTPQEANRWRPSTDGVADKDRQITRVKESEAQQLREFLKTNYNYDPGDYDNYPASQKNIKLLARVDWNINNDHHLAVRYNYTSSNQWKLPSTSRDITTASFSTASEYGLVFSNSMYNQMNNIWTLSADLNSRLSDNMSNQLLVTYSNIEDYRGSNSDFFPFVEILAGDLGADSKNEPYFDLGYELFSYRNRVLNTVLNVKDDVTYYMGDHKLTAGVSYEAQMALNTYMRNGTGTFRYASLSDFMNYEAPIEMAFDWGYGGDEYPSATVTFNQVGAYLQDEWTASEKLKLTAGIRFDTLIFDNSDILTNNAIYALDYNGRHVDTGMWPKPNLQISPRVGFTYDVFGDKSLKVRGGTGLFVGRLPLVFFTNMPTNAGIVKGRVTKVKDAEILAACMDSNGKLITDRWALLDALNKVNPTAFPKDVTPETAKIDPLVTSEVAGVDPDFKMPQVWKSSLAVDYTVPVSFPMSFTAEYIFNKTINGVMLTNWNIPEDNSGWTSIPGADKRHLYPEDYKYTSLDAYMLTNTNKGYGYIATVSMNAQPVKNLDIIASYTHTVSKEVTGMPGSNASAAFTYIPSVDGPNYNILHNSSYNLPDRIMVSVNYTDPIHNHWGLLYEGLRYSGNSYVYNGDLNGDGNAYDLMYIPKDDEIGLAGSTAGYRFKTQDDLDRYVEFVAQDEYLSSRKGKYAEAYAICQPFRHVFDFRFAHDFAIKQPNGAKHTLQLSMDVKNIGNLFNSRWGVAKTFSSDIPYDSKNSLVKVLKYDSQDTDGTPVFTTSVPSGVSTWDYNHSWGNCWYMQLGLRYMFN